MRGVTQDQLVGHKAKASFLLRKAFSAVLYSSFNVKSISGEAAAAATFTLSSLQQLPVFPLCLLLWLVRAGGNSCVLVLSQLKEGLLEMKIIEKCLTLEIGKMNESFS